MQKPIYVTQPYLQQIWDKKILTNGTIALVTALQALRITGEGITTPYSFVGTAHSLPRKGIKPVFGIAPCQCL
jgi:DegT/DnrJ/EryC1/StrS aminotransferase family